MNASSQAHKILVIKDAQLELDGKTYGSAITAATISSSQSDVEWKPISGEDQYDIELPDYTLTVDFGQDYSSPNTLTAVLLTRAGEQVPFKLHARSGQTVAAGSVTLKVPETILGARGVATSRAAMRINGQPTFTFGSPDPVIP